MAQNELNSRRPQGWQQLVFSNLVKINGILSLHLEKRTSAQSWAALKSRVSLCPVCSQETDVGLWDWLPPFLAGDLNQATYSLLPLSPYFLICEVGITISSQNRGIKLVYYKKSLAHSLALNGFSNELLSLSSSPTSSSSSSPPPPSSSSSPWRELRL